MPVKELGAFYLISGADDLKRETAYKRLVHRFEALGDITLNLDTISATQMDVDDIIVACNTLPFASEKRLVVVFDADRIVGDDAHALAEYLKDPCQSTVLCLISKKMTKSSILLRAVSKLCPAAIIDCTPRKHRELPTLVSSMARTHGVSIDRDAVETLIGRVGESTVALDNELKKMATAIGSGGSIDSALVLEMVPRTAELKPWDLGDALAERDARKVASVLARMENQSPFSLLPICTSRIRDLICAKTLESRGQGTQLSSVLKRSAWTVRDLPRWARNYTSAELIDALVRAAMTEKLMKSGSDSDWEFEQWLLETVRR